MCLSLFDLRIIHTNFAQDELDKEKKEHSPNRARVPPKIKYRTSFQRCEHHRFRKKAGEGVRTLDNDVGNVVLCQLSYARTVNKGELYAPFRVLQVQGTKIFTRV